MDEVETLRAATREAHEAMKDMKALMKEAKALVEELRVAVAEEVVTHLEVGVRSGLQAFEAALETAIAEGEKRVFDRFDTLAELLLGEDKESRKKNSVTIHEYALAARALKDKI